MLRKIALSLLMLVSIVVVIPFADSAAHGLRQSISAYRRHHRRHSRRWWRRHRALVRQRQAARAAALAAHRNAPLMPKAMVVATATNAVSPAAASEIRFPTAVAAGVPGRTALSVVALSRPAPAYLTSREQKQMLGGVSFGELRRIVIDKMITAGGWVTNDFESEVSGRRVLVVTAQTPADSRSSEKAWNFYFTEVNGRIYNLTTEAPLQSSEQMAAEAQRLIASLH